MKTTRRALLHGLTAAVAASCLPLPAAAKRATSPAAPNLASLQALTSQEWADISRVTSLEFTIRPQHNLPADWLAPGQKLAIEIDGVEFEGAIAHAEWKTDRLDVWVWDLKEIA